MSQNRFDCVQEHDPKTINLSQGASLHLGFWTNVNALLFGFDDRRAMGMRLVQQCDGSLDLVALALKEPGDDPPICVVPDGHWRVVPESFDKTV